MVTPSDDATLVVSRKIKSGQREAYEDWLQRLIQTMREFPGYRGLTTLAPEGVDSDVRYLICRFDNKTALDNWEKSDLRNKLVDEVKNYSTQYYERTTGMETWFSLPNMKTVRAPPKWKMLIVTFLAAYAVSFIPHFLVAPYMASWSFLASNLVYTGILVVTLTYFAMPRLSILLRRWLYPNQHDV